MDGGETKHQDQHLKFTNKIPRPTRWFVFYSSRFDLREGMISSAQIEISLKSCVHASAGRASRTDIHPSQLLGGIQSDVLSPHSRSSESPSVPEPTLASHFEPNPRSIPEWLQQGPKHGSKKAPKWTPGGPPGASQEWGTLFSNTGVSP